jgi:hypothetical protein
VKRAAVATAVVLLAWAALAGAAFTLRAEVDARRVGLEDHVRYTVTIEGSGAPDDVEVPALTNLELIGGPFQSSRISIVNGRMSQTRSLTWVLQPRSVGRATVGALAVGDQATPAIEVEVVAGSVRPREPQRAPDPSAADPFGADPFAQDPFEEFFGRRRGRAVEPKLAMEALPSRTRLHVGEPLVLTYNLYTQTSVADLQLKEAPQYAGFWVEDLERPQAQPSGEAATIAGESFRRFPLLRKLLFPTRAGTLTLPPASFRIGLARQGFFDAGGVVERATKPVTVTVLPLPEAPGFSGAVGQFQTSASLDRQVIPLGEAATLRFRLQGTGNLKWIEQAPAIAASGAKIYPPQSKSELRATLDGIAGARTWEYVVVPETTGAIEIPAVAFSYFDPRAQRIVELRTEPIPLRVEGGTGSAGLPVPPPSAGAARATGALPLRADLERPPAAGLALSGRAVGLLALVALALHVVLAALSRVRGLAGAGRTASARSVRVALRDLDRARANGVSKEQAAGLVERALHEAFGEVAETDDGERARAVRALLDEVHFVRYAPQLGDYDEKIRDLAERGAAVVRRWA